MTGAIRFYTGAPVTGALETLIPHINAEIVDRVEDSEIILFPRTTGNRVVAKVSPHQEVASYRRIAREQKRPLVVFFISDYEFPFLGFSEYSALFRTGINRSKKLNNEHTLPYVWECLEAPMRPIESFAKNSISFCGATVQGNRDFVRKRFAHRQAFIRELQDDELVNRNFIIRSKFWAGMPHNAEVKKHFWDCIQSCPFAACPRGGGNWSMRFYQVMSAGRIPVLVDTNVDLPFENEINWKDLIVIVPKLGSIRESMERFADTHCLIEAQRRCGEVHQEYLSKPAFGRYLSRFFREFADSYVPPPPPETLQMKRLRRYRAMGKVR